MKTFEIAADRHPLGEIAPVVQLKNRELTGKSRLVVGGVLDRRSRSGEVFDLEALEESLLGEKEAQASRIRTRRVAEELHETGRSGGIGTKRFYRTEIRSSF